jgi:carbamoyltransferase
MKTTVLGLNAFHGDASACVIKDGKLIAAVEEERFRRIKHWAGFPSEAIKYCLEEANLKIGDVEHIAVNRDPNAHLWRKIFSSILRRPSPKLILDRIKNRQNVTDIKQNFEAEFSQNLNAKIHFIEHHACHMASAFYASPFDEAAVVSIDGFGDFSSAAWGCWKPSDHGIDNQVFFPHSLGLFYQALTQYLGFPNYGDEYKVMGLAPYGSPTYLDKMEQIVLLQPDGGFKLDLSYFRHHKDAVSFEWVGGSPKIGKLYQSKIEDLLGPARKASEDLTQYHKDIAHSVQAMYEKAFFHLLIKLYAKYKIDNLSLA